MRIYAICAIAILALLYASEKSTVGWSNSEAFVADCGFQLPQHGEMIQHKLLSEMRVWSFDTRPIKSTTGHYVRAATLSSQASGMYPCGEFKS